MAVRRSALVLLALMITLISGCTAGDPADPGDTPAAGVGTSATVVKVIDGDTVRVRIGDETELVRLLGIDTPEVENPHRPAGCYGQEASAYTRAALPVGSRVTLTSDASQGSRDRFDRLLAYVATTPGRDVMTSVNARLLLAGYARIYVIRRNPFAHAEAFREAERVARVAGRGLWSACPRE